MGKRTKPKPDPVAAVGVDRVQHGPARPARVLRGVARLRDVLDVSQSVAVDDLCEEAAMTIEKLRDDRPKRLPWGRG